MKTATNKMLINGIVNAITMGHYKSYQRIYCSNYFWTIKWLNW